MLREVTVTGGTFKRDAIDEQAIARDPNQKARPPLLGKSSSKLVPGSFKLGRRARVLKTVEARIFQYDAQAAQERAGSRHLDGTDGGAWHRCHVGPLCSRTSVVSMWPMRQITEG